MTYQSPFDRLANEELEAAYDQRDQARRIAVALECELARAEDRATRAEAELAAARNLAAEQADTIRRQLDHTSALEAAIARVRALHREVDGSPHSDGSCHQCGSDWPCDTTRAINTPKEH